MTNFSLQTTFDAAAASYGGTFMTNKGAGYQSGRFWIFYHDGLNTLFTSSIYGHTDASWSSPTTFHSGVYTVATWYDGTYVHVAYSGNNNADPLLYRRGRTNSDGTITWDSEQTAVAGAANNSFQYQSLAIDSTGHVSIAYGYGVSGSQTPYCTKNDNTNGTWSTASGFPYQLNATGKNYYGTRIVTLNNDAILVAYANNDNTVFAVRCYNGSWQTAVDVTGSIYTYYDFDLAGHRLDNNADLVYSISGYTYQRLYTYATNTLSGTTDVGGGTSYVNMAIDTRTDDIYILEHSATLPVHKYTRATSTWEAWVYYSTGTGYYSAGAICMSPIANYGLIFYYALTPVASQYDLDCTVSRFVDDFETGSLSRWVTSGSPAISSTEKNTGIYSVLSTASANYFRKYFATSQDRCYCRCYFRYDADFSAGNEMWVMATVQTGYNGVGIVAIRSNAGTMEIRVENFPASTWYSASYPFVKNQWYYVELYTVVSATVGELHVWVNGVEKLTQTGLNTGTTNILGAIFGNYYSTWSGNYYTDDCIIDSIYSGAIPSSDEYEGPSISRVLDPTRVSGATRAMGATRGSDPVR